MRSPLAATSRQPPAGAWVVSASAAVWIKLAVAYLIVATAVGIAMGASGNFVLRSVHSHLALLGWVTIALAGLIYTVYPEAGATRLARAHFWLHNLALPPMLVALAALLFGNPAAEPVLAITQILLAAGALAFCWNVFANVKAS